MILQRLQAVLTLERDLLRTGKIDGLPRLTSEKAKLAALLAQAQINAAVTERVKLDLDRNARLLQAAAQGIKQALRRAQRPVDQTLTTYNSHGRTASISTAAPSMSHRL